MKISSTFIQKRNMKTNCRTFCKMGPTDLTYGRSWFAHIIIFTIIRSCNLLYHPQLKCAYQSCSFIIVCVWDVTALYKLLVEAGIIYLSIAIICMQRNLPRIFFFKGLHDTVGQKVTWRPIFTHHSEIPSNPLRKFQQSPVLWTYWLVQGQIDWWPYKHIH